MKTSVFVAAEALGAVCRINWYAGTSDAQVEKAIRLQLHIPLDDQFLLRDVQGDVVPVSSTLPANQHFTILLERDMPMLTSSDDATTMTNSTETVDEGDEQVEVKRRRTDVDTSPNVEAVTPRPQARIIITPKRRSASGPALATIIAQFVNAFTRPIDNDDNVSFIPNTGRFALDELYNELVEDPACHPKGREIFYKMTSLYGKVDRQRVLRYYRYEAESGETAVVRLKPEGKGALLRRYRTVTTAEAMESAIKSETFVTMLKLDPKDVVTRFMRFVDGFVPISKGEFLAQFATKEDAERQS